MIAEMLKNRYNTNRPASFYFWQDTHALEVDLVVSESAQVNLFEIKSSFTIKSEFFKGINSFRKAAPEHVKGSDNVIYTGEETQPRSNGTFWSWRDVDKL